jgi:hypothetical protein
MLVRKPARQILFILLTAALTLTSCNLAGGTPAPAVDMNAISTAALATALGQISAQQTQTALAAPSATASPTNTSAPAAASIVVPGSGTILPATAAGTLPTVSFNNSSNTTPLAGFTPIGSPLAPAATFSFASGCNNAAFEEDVTILDGTVVDPGVNFEKIWKIRNTGTCMWDDGYTFVYIGGSTPDLDPYNYKFSKTSDRDFVEAGEAVDIALTLTTPCKPGKYEGHWRMRDDNNNFFGQTVSVYIEVTETKKKC